MSSRPGSGERLSRTWRGKTFPEVGESAEAAAYVWSRAPKIVDAFDCGVVIRQIFSQEELARSVPCDPDHCRRQERTECRWLARKNHAGRLAAANRAQASVRLSPWPPLAAGCG
jgi:hypothetical protein